MPHEERGGSDTEDAGARRGARGGIPSGTSMASHGDSRGAKGTLRDSGAANAAVDDQSGRHRRTSGASVSSLFAP